MARKTVKKKKTLRKKVMKKAVRKSVHKKTKKTAKKAVSKTGKRTIAAGKRVKRTRRKATNPPRKNAKEFKGEPRARAHSRSRKPRGVRPLIKIKVVGVGGGGGNAITRMRKNFSVRGVEFVAINTDLQDLESCDAHRKLHIGRVVTKGMGAGMNPDLGQQAAEENHAEIADVLEDTDMLFITSGFGGGTGTGATPIIADIAKELGILTVAVITKPFSF